MSLYVSLHFATHHYTRSHEIPCNFIHLRDIALQFYAVHCISVHVVTLPHTPLHFTTSCSTSQYIVNARSTAMHFIRCRRTSCVCIAFHVFDINRYYSSSLHILHVSAIHQVSLHRVTHHDIPLVVITWNICLSMSLRFELWHCMPLHTIFVFRENSSHSTSATASP